MQNVRVHALPDNESAVAVRSWHSATVADTLSELRATAQGLSASEAAERLRKFGPNVLPAAPRRGALARLLAQFNNLLIYVLLASALITAALGHAIDTTVIVLVVVANAVVGFVQEGRAERALDAVRRMVTPRASILREGRRITVPAEQLVPGDCVLLEAGDRVPADVRLVQARHLRVDEALLTGESVPVDKSCEPVAGESVLGERRSMAFSGTLIAAGQGLGVVVETGSQSELGRISTLLGSVGAVTTPLLRQMDRFARHLTVAILSTSAAVFFFATFVREYPWDEAFMAVVGLAVAAIPEGLPAVMTIALAIGVQRMAARKAIIRRLPAVETLGAVSIICSDKTGTLTRNEMSVRDVVTAEGPIEVTGAGYTPHGAFRAHGADVNAAGEPQLLELTRAALLCNDAHLHQPTPDAQSWQVEGDPMEGALVALAIKAGHDADLVRAQFPRTDQIPFDTRHRYMASLHHGHEDGSFICVKGAPEQILSMCDRQRTAQGDSAIDHDYWRHAIEQLATQGRRVIALATRSMPRGHRELSERDVNGDLTMLGLLGLIDPPREEALEALADCHSAGIGVRMITGDHAVTAEAIARELKLAEHISVATGRDLDALAPADLARCVRETTVFARTSPEHKLRLVEALQADGSVIAMTGDGVNDAPALKRADIGVAMGGKGTEAAKEAAEMVLVDDNFATIVAAVREGRTVYDNLRKVIGWTLPTNGGEALTLIAALLTGATLPVTPVQILWINLVTAVALGLTLAFEPPQPDVMQRPPRPPDEPLLSRQLVWRIAFVSVLFAAGAFGVFYWVLARGDELAHARTMVVNTLVSMEIFYLFSVRYVRMTSLTLTGVVGTPAVLIGVTSVLAAQLLFTYAPFMQRAFDSRAMAVADGLLVVAIGVALLLVLEVEKRLLAGRSGLTSAPPP